MHNYLSENQKIGEANNSKFYMSNMHDMSQKHAFIKLISTIFSISAFKDMICTNATLYINCICMKCVHIILFCKAHTW
jgi:hypothetical protein